MSFAGFLTATTVFGWANPLQAPPAGGVLSVDLSGRMGIGISNPGSKLGVAGAVSVGNGYADDAAPLSGFIVEGKLGVGIANFLSRLAVNGSVLIGHQQSLGYNLSTNNVAIQGAVGIGRQPGAAANIDIEGGGVRIGSTLQQGRWHTRIPMPNYVTPSSSPIASGAFNPSLVIGRDGSPLIAYDTGPTGNHVVLLKCLKLDCSTSQTLATVTGRFPALAIGASGFPFVAFWDNGTAEIKLLYCNDDACSIPTVSIVASGLPDNALQVAMAIDIAGFPFITYKTGRVDNGAVCAPFGLCSRAKFWLARCGDQTCSVSVSPSQFDTTECVDNGGSTCFVAGPSLAVAIDAEGVPVIAYSRLSLDHQFYFKRCISSNCSDTSVLIPHYIGVITRPTIAIEQDGLPLLSTGQKCLNLGCNSTPSLNIPTNRAVAIGADNLAVFSNVGSGDLSVTKCRKLGCVASFGAPNPSYSVDSIGDVANTAIAIGVDGLPIIAYTTTANDLKVAKCGSDRCIPFWTQR